MGMMTDRSVTEVFVTQNQYYFGEKAYVRVTCDNTKCSKAIKSFKLKVSRKFVGIATSGKVKTE
jgi:hypothetical protein